MPALRGIHLIVMIPPNRLYLSNFAWFDYIRPLNKDDIFVWRPAGTSLRRFATPSNFYNLWIKSKRNSLWHSLRHENLESSIILIYI